MSTQPGRAAAQRSADGAHGHCAPATLLGDTQEARALGTHRAMGKGRGTSAEHRLTALSEGERRTNKRAPRRSPTRPPTARRPAPRPARARSLYSQRTGDLDAALAPSPPSLPTETHVGRRLLFVVRAAVLALAATCGARHLAAVPHGPARLASAPRRWPVPTSREIVARASRDRRDYRETRAAAFGD